MKTIFLFCGLFLLTFGIQAQSKTQIVKVSSGELLSQAVSKDFQYALNEFTEGRVIYKNGTSATAKLNYSYLLGAMVFIDPLQKDEIFALANTADILMVVISKRQFLPVGNHSEFMEVLTGGGGIYLAVNRKVKPYIMGIEGAYGTISPTASTSFISQITGGTGNNFALPYSSMAGGKENLTIIQYVRVDIESSYYLYTNGEPIYIKNEKAYARVYPKDKVTFIEKYVVDNKINFNKEQDIIKLTKYCCRL